MSMGFEPSITKTASSRNHTCDFDNIQFGKVFSDHMFLADFDGESWHDPRIVPYGNLSLSPATSALHYGQAIFEGMKAFKAPDGQPVIFRPEANWKRLNGSAARLGMPSVPYELFLTALDTLVDVDRDWIPSRSDSALYLRPFLFATDDFVGVRPSIQFTFCIFTCPVNAYYQKPLKVKVESHFIRAAAGGTGDAKAAGNYAGAMMPTTRAQQEGFDQILWMDAHEHKYFEESGTMNLFFQIDQTLITPALDGNILNGVTRDSILTLARKRGIATEERRISIDEIVAAHETGRLKDVFGTGTAATLAPIVSIGYNGKMMQLPTPESRSMSIELASELDAIKRLLAPDPFDWIHHVSVPVN